MVDMLDDLQAIEPRKLDRQTIISMKLAADIPGLGLRFIGSDGRPFQPAQVVVMPDQQQQDGGVMPKPKPIREEPPLEVLLHHIAAPSCETAQQMAESDRRRAAREARVTPLEKFAKIASNYEIGLIGLNRDPSRYAMGTQMGLRGTRSLGGRI
ncbi:hypothetical protein E3N88_02291 [Mikania micrantha]|uniref:Uncharacterized protein n=1 Tax=Mikania micrantha TaxID=192012 RepID=A0A5N6Q3D2_9ASTR|nr:hypothetical protein E3N88_02291 [Mikania micrantha]